MPTMETIHDDKIQGYWHPADSARWPGQGPRPLSVWCGAPLLYEKLTTESLAGDGNGKPSNIAKHFQFKIGEPAKAFAEATLVVERSFTTQTVHQGYIEPHNATAFFNSDGTLTIWCSTQ